MNKDLKIIEERLTILFKRRSKTQYWLEVVNDPFDHCYNFFFNSQHQSLRLKSVPLHSVADYDLAKLESLINDLNQFTQLTIRYTGFVGQRWPSNLQPIQKKRHPDEKAE